VGDGRETFGRLLPNPLGGRFGCDQLRKTQLEVLKLSDQPVEFSIRNLGVAIDVIFFLVVADLFSELLDPPCGLFARKRFRNAWIPRAEDLYL